MPCDSVYAVPRQIPAAEKETIARVLEHTLKLDRAFLQDRLWRDKSFVWLARKVTPAQSRELRARNLKGIGFIKESKRSYPNGYLASQCIGFAGLDNSGLEGLELYYDRYLRGSPGWAVMLRDARSKKLNLYQQVSLPQDGQDIILTIDEVIQYIAERELEKAWRSSSAKGASIVVMDPWTGAILAMANCPTYDINFPGKADKEQMRNRAVCDLFEPGSVFKIVTASAALEEKKASEEDRIFCENGEYRVANHTLHDHRPHGWLTFREVIEQSSNIGTCKIAQGLGAQTVWRYCKLFGFGVKTGIDLPGEISGMVKDLRHWSKTSITAVPMGQEVGVTALQLATAISAIANGGMVLKPAMVKEIRDSRGKTVKRFIPELVRTAISEETAARVKKILIGVIETGTGKLAKSSEYTAAGKTGTAQKIEPNGTYSHSKFIASFIGFAPAQEPKIVIVVTIDEPRGAYFGGVISAPVFKNVALDTLKYLNSRESSREVIAYHDAVQSR